MEVKEDLPSSDISAAFIPKFNEVKLPSSAGNCEATHEWRAQQDIARQHMNGFVFCVSTQMCKFIRKKCVNLSQFLAYKCTLLSTSLMNFGQPSILKVPDQRLVFAKVKKLLIAPLKISLAVFVRL